MKQADIDDVKEHLPELEETLRYLCSIWTEPGKEFDFLHMAYFHIVALQDLLNADS